MATESAADTELSISLSPGLSEWLDERANALGIDRETLLLELLGTYRDAADIDGEDFATLLSNADAGVEEDRLDDLDGRIDEVDAALSEHVEDLRSRILQLKDAVNSRAPAEHDHPRIETLAQRTGVLSTDLDRLESEMSDVASEIEGLTADLDSTDDRLETVETKLDRLARAVLELKRRSEGVADSADALDSLRRTANRRGTVAADCGECGERLRIDLLTEAACPHCGHGFRDIEYPASLLRRLKTPTLTDSEPVSPETDDE